MEDREVLRSILPFLPVKLESSSLVWPIPVIEALKALSRGPSHRRVDSGEVLFVAISDLRDSLSLSPRSLAFGTGHGYALFFDEVLHLHGFAPTGILDTKNEDNLPYTNEHQLYLVGNLLNIKFLSREQSTKWFAEVIPAMANLLLRFPTLLESHYQDVDSRLDGVETRLRLLEPQQAGIVILSQELIGAILSCSFFCLFPTAQRGSKHLPMINFDLLFASLYESYRENQESKIKCLIHYFERICLCMPSGFVSFERKLLSLKRIHPLVSYPYADFWGISVVPLCQFEVRRSGLIEDHLGGALEVDFANKYLGGGALWKGCVQEEIRFMINPELIAGMLFLPSMSDNEAIEIVGAERFSNYSGYASTFRFSGDYVDIVKRDSIGRRITRIIAIDALCSPGLRQYKLDCLLREVNKAFCGFLDQSKLGCYQTQPQNKGFGHDGLENDNEDVNDTSQSQSMFDGDDMVSSETIEANQLKDDLKDMLEGTSTSRAYHHGDVGVVTGNWGCGAFGGDPEVKMAIQWLAASQALRPFISYYTFGIAALENLDQVSQWILSHNWTVGDLWNLLVDYSSKRAKGETELGFFSWLLPSLPHPRANVSK